MRQQQQNNNTLTVFVGTTNHLLNRKKEFYQDAQLVLGEKDVNKSKQM
jgi:hypothetical protein